MTYNAYKLTSHPTFATKEYVNSSVEGKIVRTCDVCNDSRTITPSSFISGSHKRALSIGKVVKHGEILFQLESKILLSLTFLILISAARFTNSLEFNSDHCHLSSQLISSSRAKPITFNLVPLMSFSFIRPRQLIVDQLFFRVSREMQQIGTENHLRDLLICEVKRLLLNLSEFESRKNIKSSQSSQIPPQMNLLSSKLVPIRSRTEQQFVGEGGFKRANDRGLTNFHHDLSSFSYGRIISHPHEVSPDIEGVFNHKKALKRLKALDQHNLRDDNSIESRSKHEIKNLDEDLVSETVYGKIAFKPSDVQLREKPFKGVGFSNQLVFESDHMKRKADTKSSSEEYGQIVLRPTEVRKKSLNS